MLTKYKLGELVEVTRGMSLPGENYSESGALIRLTLGNFNYNGGGFKENTSKSDIYYVGEVKPEFILNKGDIITPLTEQTIGLLGSTAMIPESGKYIQSQDVALITPDKSKIDHLFCYYLVSSDLVRKQLSAAAQQTKIRHTSPDKIKDCTVWIPDLELQEKIGKTLYDIDQKIALNTRMNAELEAMAKQLYDYWFVQFDFPDENGDPYKSSGGKMVWNEKLKREIPEGWEVKELGSVLDNKIKATMPGDHLKGLFYCPIDEIPIRKMSFAGGKSWEEAQSSLQLYDEKNILIGAMRVYFHRCCISSCPGITRTTTIVLTPKDKEHLSYCYQICNEERTFEFAIKESNGTQQPYVTWNSLSKYLFPYPKEKTIINQYCEKTNGIIVQVLNNVIQSNQLTILRDSLLPMLMNGQVTIE